MRNLIKHTWIWFVIVGSIAYATAVITGNALPTFISTQTIQIGSYTNTLYKLDVYNYLKQIENATYNIPWSAMVGKFPTLPKINNFADVGKLVVNMFIWLMNYYMWYLNIIVMLPTKLLLQPVIFLATVLGIDLNSNNILNIVYVYYSFTIPQIPYI